MRVVVIGAGIGGLVAGLELAARGEEVTILERAATPGGKMREVAVDGVRMDAGPTVFTMRWVFEELFAAIGESLEDHLALRPATTLARHAWSAGERLDLFADKQRSADAIGRFAGPAEARGYLEFCARAQRVYRTLEGPFIRAQKPGPVSLVAAAGLGGLPDLWRISPFRTLWQALGEHFSDPRLRQLFGRYATYCGASPFQAPATLMLVAHVEQAGVWLVEGGMHRIAATLAALAAARGARVRYGAEAAAIVVAGGRASGVRLADGEWLPADAVVVNADAAAVAEGLFGGPAASSVGRMPPQRRSLSALTWNLRTDAADFPLLRHNVFFSADYAAEFAALRRGALPPAPTVYICAQDRGDADAGPTDAAERLLVLVNAPATGDRGGVAPAELARCETAALDLLERCGLRIALAGLRTGPAEFERLFPATGGALYGQASHGWRASFTRPGARTKLPGLYLCGGSVHPGPGVPMAALSGRLAAAAALGTAA